MAMRRHGCTNEVWQQTRLFGCVNDRCSLLFTGGGLPSQDQRNRANICNGKYTMWM